MLHHPAEVRAVACSRQAGVRAVIILARSYGAAVVVHNALPAETSCVSISDESSWTLARKRSSLNKTQSSLPTRVGVTRVRLLDTFLLVADVAGQTVWVNHALWSAPCDCVWFRNESAQAPADGVPIPVSRARGSRSTRGRVAGVRLIHTLPVQADQPAVTVGVDNALRPAPRDGVRLGDEPDQAAADRVAVAVGGARCAGAAGRRVAWVTGTTTDLRGRVGH